MNYIIKFMPKENKQHSIFLNAYTQSTLFYSNPKEPFVMSEGFTVKNLRDFTGLFLELISKFHNWLEL